MDRRRKVPPPPIQCAPQDDCGREVGNLLEGPEHVRRPLGVEAVRHETIPDQRQGGDDRDDEEGVVARVTARDPLRGQEDEQRRERDEREPQIREGPIDGDRGVRRDEGQRADEERGRRQGAIERRRDAGADGGDDADGPPSDRRSDRNNAESV